MQIISWGSKLWQLSAYSVIAFLKYLCLLQTENSMTGRAYMREALVQVWLKSIKK